jgi:hypothetical protein
MSGCSKVPFSKHRDPNFCCKQSLSTSPCCRWLSTTRGRMVKLRNVHSRYTRSRKDGLRYRGPKGVSTRNTPQNSFSIHIRAALFTDKKIVATLSGKGQQFLHHVECMQSLSFKRRANQGGDGFPFFQRPLGQRKGVCNDFDQNRKKLCTLRERRHQLDPLGRSHFSYRKSYSSHPAGMPKMSAGGVFQAIETRGRSERTDGCYNQSFSTRAVMCR